MSSVFPPIGGAAFIPMRQCRGLRQDLVKETRIDVLDKSALYSSPPIMQFNKLTRTAVGADLSRPQPIYRPRVGSRIYPVYFVKTYYRGGR